MKEYLVTGEFGSQAGDYCEEIITAKTPEEATCYFIRSMKKNPYLWKNMGEHNVRVQEYVPTQPRCRIPMALSHEWEPDGMALSELSTQIALYEARIIELGGVADSGWVDFYDLSLCDHSFVIKYHRYETDRERNTRLTDESNEAAQLRAATAPCEAEEREEYARLKKKYGE
jgi:hypothetical protein